MPSRSCKQKEHCIRCFSIITSFIHHAFSTHQRYSPAPPRPPRTHDYPPFPRLSHECRVNIHTETLCLNEMATRLLKHSPSPRWDFSIIPAVLKRDLGEGVIHYGRATRLSLPIVSISQQLTPFGNGRGSHLGEGGWRQYDLEAQCRTAQCFLVTPLLNGRVRIRISMAG